MISEKRVDAVEEMQNNGMKVEAIAEKLNVAIHTARRYLRMVSNRTKEPRQVPKVFLFDIETAPLLATLWGIYKQRVPYENIQDLKITFIYKNSTFYNK